MAELHSSYAEKGLRILAFPCNQFGAQEPGTNQEIKRFALDRGAKYDLFSKIDVNGDDRDDLQHCSAIRCVAFASIHHHSCTAGTDAPVRMSHRSLDSPLSLTGQSPTVRYTYCTPSTKIVLRARAGRIRINQSRIDSCCTGSNGPDHVSYCVHT